MPDDDDNLPIINVEDLPQDQILDTLATSLCAFTNKTADEDEDDLIEDYPLDELNLDDDEEPREELEPDDEDDEGGDYEYDIGED